MRLTEFKFDLPESLIATEPVEPRDHSRLLVIDRKSGKIEHRHFYDLPDLLSPSDLLVLNNTRVIPARLMGKNRTGATMEVFLIKPSANPGRWHCLVKPGRKVKERLEIIFATGDVGVIHRNPAGFEIEFPEIAVAKLDAWLERAGQTPLPPYIKRDPTPGDRLRYQTVFAKDSGSIAAPTAGLHFTDELLKKLKAAIVELTLHVGYGTFIPILVEDLDDHRMHEESFSVPPDLLDRIRKTREAGGRVIPVGTTSLRTLESLQPGVTEGATSIFIQPGYEFRHSDALITNFHLPESSLFVLICALLGTERAQTCYREAIKEQYRFYSYGDAMLIL